MKTSVGIDIVDVKDFEGRLKISKKLAERLFTYHEIEYCKKKGIEHLASRFAAKEAFMKASGLKNISWQDVEIKNSKTGKPYLNIKKELMKKADINAIDVSISNLKNIAIAVVVINR